MNPDRIPLATRGLGLLIERGDWILWSGMGDYWRKLTPQAPCRIGQEVVVAPDGCRLGSPVDALGRDVSEVEEAYLCEIIRRVYMEPQKRSEENARKAVEREQAAARRAWLEKLETLGAQSISA